MHERPEGGPRGGLPPIPIPPSIDATQMHRMRAGFLAMHRGCSIVQVGVCIH